MVFETVKFNLWLILGHETCKIEYNINKLNKFIFLEISIDILCLFTTLNEKYYILFRLILNFAFTKEETNNLNINQVF